MGGGVGEFSPDGPHLLQDGGGRGEEKRESWHISCETLDCVIVVARSSF